MPGLARASSRLLLAGGLLLVAATVQAKPAALRLNDRGYFSMPGLDVMAFQDIYAEGHQAGIGIIQNGVRVASNGDLRLEPAPGQWSPTPVQNARQVDAGRGEIVTALAYPDPSKDRKGFNPLEYPRDLNLSYRVRVRAEGPAVRVTVDLDKPLPAAWVGRVGFNLELFPGALFGRTFYADGQAGSFPRQPNGPVDVDGDKRVQPRPLAWGRRLVVAPETPAQRLTIESHGTPLELLDGRTNFQNGWFIVRATVPAGATARAVDWTIAPNALPNWTYAPQIHVSQVGYHPDQKKIAVIELDAGAKRLAQASLLRIGDDGKAERVLTAAPRAWGTFLRYRYAQLDFTAVQREGVYVVEYAGARTPPFRIGRDVYQRGV